MKVITLNNEKGGVGKTTLTTHIGAGLAIKGYRVVIIDADPQANSTIAFGLRHEAGLYNLLVREAEFKDVLRVIPPERYQFPDRPVEGFLTVLPSNIETRTITQLIDNAFELRERLNEISDSIDVVIFDTSPTPSLLHGSIYIATHGIIYPTELTAWSLNGLVDSFKHRESFSSTKKKLGMGEIATLGIVPNKTRLRTIEHGENLQMLVERYGDRVWEPIQMRISWEEAAMQRESIFKYAPESFAAQEMWQVIERTEKAMNELQEVAQ